MSEDFLFQWNVWKTFLDYLRDGKEDKFDQHIKYHGINGQFEPEDFTLLHYACWHGEVEIVKKLIEKGANINATNFDNRTPLHIAAQYGCLDVVKILVEHGANLKVKLNTGNININQNFGGSDKMTPMEVADCYHHEDIADYLMEKVAVKDAQSKNAWLRNIWDFLKSILTFGCLKVNHEEVEEDFNANESDDQFDEIPITYESIANTWPRRRLENPEIASTSASLSTNLAMIC